MSTPKEKCLAKPAELSRKGVAAFDIIVKFLTEREMTAELMVVYDGGDHRSAFNMDVCLGVANMMRAEGVPVKNSYATYEAMSAALRKIGCYIEECTGWYAVVYRGSP